MNCMKTQYNRYKRSLGGMIAVLACTAAAVHADPIPVDSGYTATASTNPGAYGDTDGVELTDGNVGSLVWPSAGIDSAPLVGWENIDASVMFNFSSTVTIGEIVCWFADSNGSAGVGVPESIRVTTSGGFDQTFPVTNPAGGGTTAPIAISGLSLETDNVTLDIARNTGVNPDACCSGYSWTMLSEVQFLTPPDPNQQSLIAPSEFDFGTVNNDPPQIMALVDISNITTAVSNLTITDVSIQGGDTSNFSIGSFPASLAPDETGQIALTFDSGGSLGSYGSSIVVTSNDDSSPAIIPVMAQVIQPLTPSTPYQQAVVAHNPLLYWTFDEADDTDIASSLVNNTVDNQLVAQGATTRVASTTTAGSVDLGRAASFNGASGTRFFAANLAPTSSISQFAIELWMNAADPNANQYISETFNELNTVANESSIIYGYNDGVAELFSGDRSGTAVIGGSWHHLVLASYGDGNALDGGDVEMYVDGVSVAVSGDFDSNHSFGKIAIGATAFDGTGAFNGLVDEYAIYDLTGLEDTAARKAHVANIAGHFALSAEENFFRITEIARIPGNKIRITWNSKPSTTYSIFYSTDLTSFTNNVDDSIESVSTSTTFEFDNPSIDFGNPQGSPDLYFIVSENE